MTLVRKFKCFVLLILKSYLCNEYALIIFCSNILLIDVAFPYVSSQMVTFMSSSI